MPDEVIESGSPRAAEVFSFFEICGADGQLLEKVPRNTWQLVDRLKHYTDEQEVTIFAYFPELAPVAEKKEAGKDNGKDGGKGGGEPPRVLLTRHAMGRGPASKVAKSLENSPACVPDQAAVAMIQERLQLVFERTRVQAVHVTFLFDTEGGRVGGGLSINPANQPDPKRLLMLGGAIAGQGDMLKTRARQAASLEIGPSPVILMPGDPGFKL